MARRGLGPVNSSLWPAPCWPFSCALDAAASARVSQAGEFAALTLPIVEHPTLNGETIWLDGALRMSPR